MAFRSWLFTPKNFRYETNNVIIALKNNGLYLQHVGIKYKTDPNIVLLAVQQNKDAIKYAGKELREIIGKENPVKALNSLILSEKLHTVLPTKLNGKLLSKIKI